MTWYVFRRQVAVNQAKQLVETGSLPAFDVADTDFSDPVPVRALSPAPAAPGSGTGALLAGNLVTVDGFATIEFESQLPELYLKSGSASPIYVEASLQGLRGDWASAVKYRNVLAINTAYAVNELVRFNNVTYRVATAFTTGGTLPTTVPAQLEALGAQSLDATALLALLTAGTGITLEVVSGKVVITSTASGGGTSTLGAITDMSDLAEQFNKAGGAQGDPALMRALIGAMGFNDPTSPAVRNQVPSVRRYNTTTNTWPARATGYAVDIAMAPSTSTAAPTDAVIGDKIEYDA